MRIRRRFSPISPLRFGARFLILFIVWSLVRFFVFLPIDQPKQAPILYQCYMDAKPLNKSEEKLLESLEDVLHSKVKPIPGRTIFFHETQCQPPDSRYILNLETRQACAIESAALHNPNLQIFVLFTSPTFLSKMAKRRKPNIKAILGYKNVHFRQLNLWRYAENTPMEAWIKRDDLLRSSFLSEYGWDLQRMLSLYHFGGIYLDLDVVVLHSLEHLTLNFMGAQLNTTIGNGIVGLKPYGVGHLFAELVLRNIQKQYDGNIWNQNGPGSLARVMSKICATNKISQMIKNPESCYGLRVHNISSFYEINWLEWFYLFEPKLANHTLQRLRNSYVVQIWSHINYDWPLRVDSNAAYIQLARQNCPRVFAKTRKLFN